jgi:excisionase family DNA binding protein
VTKRALLLGSVRVSERLLRTRDVAELLDVSCETILRWHRSGKLPGGYILASNVLRFHETEVHDWLEMHRAAPRVPGGYRPEAVA